MALPLGKSFCDLNIPLQIHEDANSKLDLVRRALVLGYQTIALNVKVDQKDFAAKGKSSKKMKKSENNVDLMDFPQPPKLSLQESDYPDLARNGQKPQLLSRLTITFQDNDFLYTFNHSSTVQHYDILAVCPESAQSLQNLLKSRFKPDIIAFDPELPVNMRWSRKLYNECVEKNIFFELPYAAMIRDQTIRRRVIAQAHLYHAVGRSKNVIVSSDALSPMELRGPCDVANLGYLLGLDQQQGKAAVSRGARMAVRAAAGRKLGPYRATAIPLDQLQPEDHYKVPECHADSTMQ